MKVGNLNQVEDDYTDKVCGIGNSATNVIHGVPGRHPLNNILLPKGIPLLKWICFHIDHSPLQIGRIGCNPDVTGLAVCLNNGQTESVESISLIDFH